MDKEKLKKKLTPAQYDVCVLGGTEAPFSGELLDNKKTGTYHCAVCEQELFSSETKYESASGWPSFYDLVDESRVKLLDDDELGMHRVEIRCNNCDAHLGHVFEDGPTDKTGKRYCINSVALLFKEV